MTGLSSVSLSKSAKKKIPPGARVYSGSNCEWIDLNKVLSDGIGCANGHKFVVKPKSGPERLQLMGYNEWSEFCSGNRRQLLFVNGKTIIAFVTRGSKFADCSSFTEVTTEVDCKVRIICSSAPHFTLLPPGQAVANLETVSLPSACSVNSTGNIVTSVSLLSTQYSPAICSR